MALQQVGTAPLKLNPITLGPVSAGAYRVSFAGKAPVGAKLILALPEPGNAIDVTHANPHHLIDSHNLGRFLALIGNAGLWGKEGRCRLFIQHGAKTELASNEVTFDCPVRPLVRRHGLGGPSLGISHSELLSLAYAAENLHGANGRYLHMPAIDGCTYFRNGRTGTLEVDDDMRGLVCTSYIGAVWGVTATSNGPMTWRGTAIASCSGAPFYCENVGVNARLLPEVKAFLKRRANETFLVGSNSHIVLVVRGNVHDFTTAPRQGYNVRPVDQWRPAAHEWTVGKPKSQF
jgi:hypothetical protein